MRRNDTQKGKTFPFCWPARCLAYRKNIPDATYENLSVYPHDTPFAVPRFFTVFRRIPPARPAAILRAFLLEELSYPPISDPLSSGLGLSTILFSLDFSCVQKVFPSQRNNPMNQVFFNEGGVALDASKRINSPSSTYRGRNKNSKFPVRPRTLTM